MLARTRDSPPPDAVFAVMGNDRRRYVFHLLKRHDEIGFGRLVDRVAAWENDTTVEALDGDQRKRVRSALRQFHLPKMEDLGLVRYDRERETVALSDDGASLDVYVEVVAPWDVPWGPYYLVLSGLFGVTLAASTLTALPLVGRWTLPVAVCFTVAFAVSALVHTYVSYARMRLGDGDEPPGVSRP
jgi:DNA-binding transcriptional ArsR family regulator